MQFSSVVVALTAVTAVSAASNNSSNATTSSEAAGVQVVGAGVFGAAVAAGVALLI